MKQAALMVIALCGLPLAANAGEGWLHYGGDSSGTRHSAATQITPGNVMRLREAWSFRTGDLEAHAADMQHTAFQATPILFAGSLIFCTPFNEVIALDPGTGVQKWRHDPKVATGYRPGNSFVCRGVTPWVDTSATLEDLCASRVFMGTVDARLIALDAVTGQPCPGFGMHGEVRIDPGMKLEWPGEFQITSPPAVANDVVVVGSSISDNRRADAPKGTVRAFDVRTGEPRWDFNPVTRGAQDHPESWPRDDVAARTGHANVWAPIAVDEARGLFILPTSSPSPDFFGGMRAGDNRYANSVVAVEAATGKVRWHFQTVHHDVWDYDLPAQPSLVTLLRAGKSVDAVVQVTKMGFIFVLDRDTGEPIFEVEERPVPQGGAAGEFLSPTQPFPVAPPPLVPQHLKPEDAWGLTYWDRKACREKIEKSRSAGLYTPPSERGTIMFPFTGGGANWGGAAFDPATQTLFINTNRTAHLITLIPSENFAAVKAAQPGVEISPQLPARWAVKRELLLSPLGLPCNPPPWGMLAAVNLSDGTIKWESVLGTVGDVAPIPIPLKWGVPNFGGPVVTASGIVFIGAAMGNYLRAFDAHSGEELWKGRLPAGGHATPMTYLWEGRQFVVIAAGGYARLGTPVADSVIAFALPG